MVVNINLAMVEQVRDIALRAGKVIMDIYKTDFTVTAKGDNSPVTEADRLADALIVKALREDVTDRFPIVSEETFEATNPTAVAGTPFWLVDPLDGTREFINKRDEFTVNIALIDAGLPVFGVVHVPALGSTYWGSRNGAFAIEKGGPVHPIKVRKAPADGLASCVSRSHRSPEDGEFLKPLTIKEEISAGSSLKFCLVASGRCDLYPRFGRTMEWDTAAGNAVVRFAGGFVKKIDGGDLTYGKPGFENPHFIVKGDPLVANAR